VHGGGPPRGPHPARGFARAAPPPKQPGRGAVGVACGGWVRADAQAWRGAGGARMSCACAVLREGCAPAGPGTRRTACAGLSAGREVQAGRRGPGDVGNGGIVAYGARSPAPRQRGHARTRPLPLMFFRRS